jgi:hypothetical protein
MLNGIGDFVTIKNAGDTEFVYLYANEKFTLAPGAQRVVPWGHFDKLMGNPFLTNTTREQERARCYKQLHVLYGTYGDENRRDEWPKLEAYDADGERIQSVLDDPTGTNAPTTNAGDDLDPAALRAQLDQMAKRQATLEQLLRVHERATPNVDIDTPEDPAPPISKTPSLDLDTPPDVIPDVPEDTPKKTPVRSRRSSS